MSKTQCVYPQVDCLIATEEILGENREWYSVNEKQKKFIKEIFNNCKNEVKGMSELESIASWEASVINQFLKKNGFNNIKLNDFNKNEFGAASKLDVLVEWLVEGDSIKCKTVEGKSYDAAKMPSTTVEYYNAQGHSSPIAKLLTKNDEYFVYMTMLDKEPKQLELMAKAMKLQDSLIPSMDYENLIFPYVALDEKVDISWMLGMKTEDKSGAQWHISQAKQQTKLKMNEKGARAKSAVAIGIATVSMPPQQDYIIDRPFLVWFEKPGLSKPLIASYITEEDWKKPKNLN